MQLGVLTVRVGADLSDLSDGLSKATGKLGDFGGKMQSIGTKMSAAITLPLVGIGVASTKMASDAGEAASKFQVVFGDAAVAVNRWAADLQKVVPATTAELHGMTAEIQDLLVPLGMAPEAAAGMTKEVVKLAADLASFNNIPMSEALERIRSGLVGQYEPLLKFGVALNASTVEAKALEMGLIKQGEALTPLARAQASFAVTLQNTSAAHGDAARTADSAANSFKFFTRDVKELAVTIGNVLLPVVVPMIQKLTSSLQLFQNLSPTTQKVIVVVGALVAAIGPLLVIFGTLLTSAAAVSLAFGTTLPLAMGKLLPFLGPAGLIAAGIIALVVVWTKWGDEIKAINAKIDASMRGLWDAVKAVNTGIGSAFASLRTTVVETVTAMVSGIHSQLVGRFTAIVDTVRAKVDAVTGAFRGMWDKVVGHSYVPDMITGISVEFAKLDSVMVQPTLAATNQVSAGFENLRVSVEKVSTRSVRAAETMRGGLLGAFDSISGSIGGLVGQLDGFLGKMGGVGQAIQSLIGGKGGVGGAITSMIAGLIPGGTLANAAIGILGPIAKNQLMSAGKKLTGFVGGLFGKKKKSAPKPPPAATGPSGFMGVGRAAFSDEEILQELRASVNIQQYSAEQQAALNEELIASLEDVRSEIRRQNDALVPLEV